MSDKNNLFEILKGRSLINRERSIYFKHPSVLDQLGQDAIEEEFFLKGQELGLLSQKEIIQDCIKKDKWSYEKEERIKDLQWVIEKKTKAGSKLSDKKLQEENEKSIEEDRKQLKLLLDEKAHLTKNSLEEYVQIKTYSTVCRDHCFYKGLTKKIAPEETRLVINDYVKVYNKLRDIENLLRACYQSDFFQLIKLNKDPKFIFNRSGLEITIFQKDLLICGTMLLAKINNISNIPNAVLDDPIKLYHFIPKEKEEVPINIRKNVESKGGLENMKPSDKIT